MLDGRLKRAINKVAKAELSMALEKFKWNKPRTAKYLGITPPTLRTYIRELRIKPQRKETPCNDQKLSPSEN